MRERTVLGPTGLDQFFLSQNVQFEAYIPYIISRYINGVYCNSITAQCMFIRIIYVISLKYYMNNALSITKGFYKTSI